MYLAQNNLLVKSYLKIQKLIQKYKIIINYLDSIFVYFISTCLAKKCDLRRSN